MHLRAFVNLTHKPLLVVFALLISANLGLPQNFVDLKPSPQQVAWQDLEFGVIIHFGPNTFMDREWGDGTAEHKQQDPDVERAVDNDPDTFWSAPQGSHHSTLEINLGRSVTFDHALIMERLANGQHVQAFRIEVWDGATWKTVAADHSIGHKRIESFAAQTASRVRLNTLSSTDTAEIAEFQLFSIGDKSASPSSNLQ